MRSRAVDIALGAGCQARLSWPQPDRVEMVVRRADGTVTRRVRGPWTRPALVAADAEIRHLATRALDLGAPSPVTP